MDFDQIKDVLDLLYNDKEFKSKIPETALKLAIAQITKKTDRGSITRAINSMCDLDILQIRLGDTYISDQGYKLLGVVKNE